MKQAIFLMAAAVCSLSLTPVHAEDAAEASEFAIENSSASILLTAAQKAKDFAQYRYAYTVEHWTSDGENEATLTLRFDPRLDEGARWTLLAPAEEDLSKPQQKALKKFKKGDVQDDPILYDGLEDVLPKAKLVSETEAEAVFVAQVDEDDAPKDALEVYVTLNKPGAYVSSIELRSIQPFKPAPVAKVNALTQTQYFAAPEGDGPAFITSGESHIQGEAMFKSFDSSARQTFSGIEMIELPAETEE